MQEECGPLYSSSGSRGGTVAMTQLGARNRRETRSRYSPLNRGNPKNCVKFAARIRTLPLAMGDSWRRAAGRRSAIIVKKRSLYGKRNARRKPKILFLFFSEISADKNKEKGTFSHSIGCDPGHSDKQRCAGTSGISNGIKNCSVDTRVFSPFFFPTPRQKSANQST